MRATRAHSLRALKFGTKGDDNTYCRHQFVSHLGKFYLKFLLLTERVFWILEELGRLEGQDLFPLFFTFSFPPGSLWARISGNSSILNIIIFTYSKGILIFYINFNKCRKFGQMVHKLAPNFKNLGSEGCSDSSVTTFTPKVFGYTSLPAKLLSVIFTFSSLLPSLLPFSSAFLPPIFLPFSSSFSPFPPHLLLLFLFKN